MFAFAIATKIIGKEQQQKAVGNHKQEYVACVTTCQDYNECIRAYNRVAQIPVVKTSMEKFCTQAIEEKF